MKMKTYKALLDGQETTAKKVNGRWLVGGDVDTTGNVLVLMDKNGRPAWFKLVGCYLKFEDFV